MNAHKNSISSLPTSSFSHSALILAAGLISSTLSCGEPTPGPFRAIETGQVIEQLTPANVVANAGSIVEPSPAIRLKDKLTAKPLAGVKVEFRAGPGSGFVEKPFTTTDSSGFATAGLWQVGTRPGRWELEVVAGDMETSFYVQVKPDVPARLEFSTTILIGRSGEVIDGPTVVVHDRFYNPTPQIPVTFTIVAGDGSLETSTRLTGAEGKATVGPWRLGSLGENALIATAEGIEPVRFTALALDPATMTRYTLDAVRLGTTVRTLPWLGVSRSTLAITSFDRCLCRSQAGHYIINIDYDTPSTVETNRIAGEYAIEPPLLRLVANEIKSLALVGDRIEIEIERDTRDERWVETWIYRPDNTP